MGAAVQARLLESKLVWTMGCQVLSTPRTSVTNRSGILRNELRSVNEFYCSLSLCLSIHVPACLALSGSLSVSVSLSLFFNFVFCHTVYYFHSMCGMCGRSFSHTTLVLHFGKLIQLQTSQLAVFDIIFYTGKISVCTFATCRRQIC